MKFASAVLLAASLFAVPLASAADAEPPSETVRGYFDALGRQDFTRALSLTSGAAQKRTEKMVGDLRQQAAAAHAQVELKVTRVDVDDAVTDGDSVKVSFHIDVIGKKWMFKKVARRLEGTAHFRVEGAAEPRIVAIDGQLAE